LFRRQSMCPFNVINHPCRAIFPFKFSTANFTYRFIVAHTDTSCKATIWLYPKLILFQYPLLIQLKNLRYNFHLWKEWALLQSKFDGLKSNLKLLPRQTLIGIMPKILPHLVLLMQPLLLSYSWIAMIACC